uniref:THAP-type domain-containing protein n=1 Tax=Glossina brevipalpis TaxID=37001 RepID=A0A1A9WAG0_9MUSC
MTSHKKCLAKSCPGNNTGRIRMYRFPRDEQTFKKWVENLKINVFHVNTNSRVCIRHFRSEFIGERRLKLYAVPTLVLGYNERPPHDFHKSRNRKKCCVKNCIPFPDTSFFSFPTDPTLRQEWNIACRINDENKIKHRFVCEKHFDPKLVRFCRLAPNSIPTLHLELPSKDEDVEMFEEVLSETELSERPVSEPIEIEGLDGSSRDSFESYEQYIIEEPETMDTNKKINECKKFSCILDAEMKDMQKSAIATKKSNTEGRSVCEDHMYKNLFLKQKMENNKLRNALQQLQGKYQAVVKQRDDKITKLKNAITDLQLKLRDLKSLAAFEDN